jgi:N-acyl-D-aspartate/D-glutamate deacylase
MTSFAAEAAGLPDRGLVRPASPPTSRFRSATVRSNATFETPNRYSEGFRHVAVNGVLVIDDGKITGKKPGRALKGPGYGKPSTAELPSAKPAG